MIYNNIHKKILEEAGRTGWDESSQILHLTSFIEQEGLGEKFATFIKEVADEEEADAKRMYEDEQS
jgi:hypothetical protein